MTVATGYAYLHEAGRGMVGVLSDSRLTWEDGRYAETAVKAHDLGSRVAVVSAGLGLVGPYAAEITRSVIDTSSERADQPPIGLWDAVRLFCHFVREIHRELRTAHADHQPQRVSNEFAIVGFYGDGAPGIAHAKLSPSHEGVQFWRPQETELTSVTIGASPAKDIVAAAYADYRPSRDPHWNEAVAGAMLYAMRAEGEPFRSVGGGLALGFCTMAHQRFVWPAVEVSGDRYFRGFLIPPSHTGPNVRADSVLRLSVDVEYAAELDRRIEDAKHAPVTKAGKAPAYECSLDELFGEGAIFRRSAEPDALRGGSSGPSLVGPSIE
jgi:hypothetical protein